MVESESESSTWESFFSESEDEVDIVLNEQDAIICNLTQEVKDLDAYSDHLLEELTELHKYVKHNVVRCSKILRQLIDVIGLDPEDIENNNKYYKNEIISVLRILNSMCSKVNI